MQLASMSRGFPPPSSHLNLQRPNFNESVNERFGPTTPSSPLSSDTHETYEQASGRTDPQERPTTPYMMRTCHLPTPQSPNKVSTYNPAPPSSPLSSALPHTNSSLQPETPPQQRSIRAVSPFPQPEFSSPIGVQFATPDSSPLVPFRRSSPKFPSVPHRPHLTGKRHSRGDSITSVTLESSPTPTHVHMGSSHSSPRSTVGSGEKIGFQPSTPSLQKANSTGSHKLSYSPPVGPTTPSSSKAIELHDMSSPFRENNAIPSSDALSDDVPSSDRLPGGELERLRIHRQLLEKERLESLESRRPDYLRRFTNNVDLSSDHDTFSDKSAEKSALGIMESPMKGRRIQLFDFKTTSAESFEESLMTHGYGTYGEPKTPRRATGAAGLDSTAYEWLATATPSGPSKDSDPEPTVEDSKKRRRLEAFAKTQPSTSTVRPLEIEGKGRVLWDLPIEVPEEIPPSPAKKRNLRKKKNLAPSDKKGKGIASTLLPDKVEEPKWLDDQFPWSARAREKDDASKAKQAERLRLIERFLDRTSDSEDEDERKEELVPSSSLGQVYEDPPLPSRRGRGKMVPLMADPGPARSSANQRQNVFFPSDPADAKAALLSKKSVRMLAYRKYQPVTGGNAGRDDDIVDCICGRNDEEAASTVQCDNCNFWFHVRCVVRDEADLGSESDPWYCPRCVTWREASRELTPEPRSLRPRTPPHPTLVPSDDLPYSYGRDDASLFSSSPHHSALRPWATSSRLSLPQSPGRPDIYTASPHWDDPYRAGPSTPYSSSRTAANDPVGRFDDDPLLDLNSTPSRGIKLGVPFVTPRSSWANHTNTFLATPQQESQWGASSSSHPSSSGGKNQLPRRNIYSYDDTPIYRNQSQAIHSFPRRLFESPTGKPRASSSLTSAEPPPLLRFRPQPDRKPEETNGRSSLSSSENG